MSSPIPQHQDFDYIVSSGGIDEYQLKHNGLRVLLMEDFSAPVVMVMVTYMVGSRNEAIGYTGSTHLLEHLMFKGSKEFNKENGKSIWTVLQNIGAMINATTWNDRTNYFELLPKEYLETALRIESDRMRNAFIKEDDRKPEMTVVRNEFERGENEPRQALDKHIWATAYMAHPYHHSAIGWRSDIENVPIERLKEFYETFYHPSNAYLTVIGDFSRLPTMSLISTLFGSYNAAPKSIPQMYTTEPVQEGPRRVTLKRAGKVSVIGVAHKSPPGLHSDTFSLKALQQILTNGQSSRFYKKIIDKGLGTAATVSNYQFKDPGLFVTYVTLTPGTELATIEKIILDEYENIKTNGVTEEEVKRAKAQLRTDILFTRDGAYSVASSLNEAIARGDWKSYTTVLTNINNVTPEMIQQAAIKYFEEDQSTIGYFIPKNDGQEDKKSTENASTQLETIAPNTANQNQVNASASLSERIKQSEPVKGIQTYCMKTGVAEIVNIRGSFVGGSHFSENPAVAQLTAKMLDQGTKKRTKFEIAEILGSVGASISFRVNNFRVSFNASCLKENVDLVISLIGEQLQQPRFTDEDFETIKKRTIGALEQAKQNTGTQGSIALSQLIYPKDHPNYERDTDEEIALINSAKIDDIRKFHESSYGVGTMIVVSVGDVDEKVINSSIQENFSSWKQSALSIAPPTVKALPLEPKKKEVIIKDKTSVDVYIGHSIGIDRLHPDYLPLHVGVFALGGNFSARLNASVRDKEGLTYGIRAYLDSIDNGQDGHWNVWSTFSPTLLDKGMKSILEQVSKWINEGITEEELANKKNTITGVFKVDLANSSSLANSILANAERKRPTSYLDVYPKLVESITLDQVNDVIRKYVNVNNLVTVAAGSLETQQSKL